MYIKRKYIRAKPSILTTDPTDSRSNTECNARRRIKKVFEWSIKKCRYSI